MLILALSPLIGGFARSRGWSWWRVIVLVVGSNILASVIFLFLSNTRICHRGSPADSSPSSHQSHLAHSEDVKLAQRGDAKRAQRA